jgi:hypothetical protein
MKFVFNPDPFLLPSYRISPFSSSSIDENNKIDESYIDVFVEYCNHRFGVNNWLVTKNGRQAINLSFKLIGVNYESEVTVLTTSQNFYISSCVTNEIEKFCSWSRVKSDKTKLLLINHEFGYPFPDLATIKDTGLPFVEDCCTTFFSQNNDYSVGKIGDFSAYSFPKFFPIQIGGLIVGDGVGKRSILSKDSGLKREEVNYIGKVVGYWLLNKYEILNKREFIFDYSNLQFESLGFSLRFPKEVGVTPSVLLLRNNGIIKNLELHRAFLDQHGIQNSVFYGEDAFFIPCHQNLNLGDVDYFSSVIEKYVISQNDYS